MKGVVIEKKLFSRIIKDKKAKSKEKDELKKMEEEFQQNIVKLKAKLVEKLGLLVNNKVSQGVLNQFKQEIVPKGAKFTAGILNEIDFYDGQPEQMDDRQR